MLFQSWHVLDDLPLNPGKGHLIALTWKEIVRSTLSSDFLKDSCWSFELLKWLVCDPLLQLEHCPNEGNLRYQSIEIRSSPLLLWS